MNIRKTWLSTCLALACIGFTQRGDVALKDLYKKDFYIGAALNGRQAGSQDPQAEAIIARHYNTISPENLLKWESVHPRPDSYNFKPADDYVALGQKHNMFIVGHALVWHQQTPAWVFEDEQGKPLGKNQLLKRMEEHIQAVAGRYKGKINGWDVVNEALNDDGTMRQSKWQQQIGDDFVAQAFTFARKADPAAELYYNDYNMWKPAKRDGAIRLVKSLQEKGIKVDAIGMQGHWGLKTPTIAQIEESIVAFAKTGAKVVITELDIDVLPNPSNRQGADIDATFGFDEKYNLYTDGLPDDVQQELAARYAEIFKLFRKHQDKISRVTFWGVTDRDSWLNDWPIKGRTSYPMLFDRNYQPKPAFEAVVKAAAKK
ncbi:endo-1,4-beta-xylanase [Pontibacter qinzhouensis]|uniref:Beta-xylanase n=1 Tax=Pontibacter qinzhouensis TaxID=2603253 RepID=A0A5C8KA83_9BACT|nr:endo-1,4-beta-xylanase [Pontibacter qinzhouensis]TXK49854.1 endo-1,4-beta-xylanase [Pontibacter qinzhouensis]